MKKILIIKPGSARDLSVFSEKGDYEDWFALGMGVKKDKIAVSEIFKGEIPSGFEDISGIIITGSARMITDIPDWALKAAAWIKEAVSKGIPALGVCYGHQLLAYSLGGKVDFNPKGRELGTVKVNLTDEAAKDDLFKIFPDEIEVHVSHSQTVTELPPGAVRLAFNNMDNNHAFRFGECAWGNQFHPEFDPTITECIIRQRREAILSEGLDPDKMLESVSDSPHGFQLLQRFLEIIRKRES
jgi:GMP synthase (glutamine-hydrolysing)